MVSVYIRMKLLHFRTRNKIHNVNYQNVPGPLFSQGEEEEEDWDAEENHYEQIITGIRKLQDVTYKTQTALSLILRGVKELGKKMLSK